MEDMPNHPRLIVRGTTFWHRAAVPRDIKATYPKSEETFSLRTKDPKQALIEVRRAAMEVDQRFEAHRRSISAGSSELLEEVTSVQLAHIEAVYFQHVLEEDDDARLDRFYKANGQLPAYPKKTFEEHVEDASAFEQSARYLFARGESDLFFQSEAKDVLGWSNVSLRLKPSSKSWFAVERAIQAAIIKASDLVKRRNIGDVVPTPEPTRSETESKQGPLLSAVREEWIAEKSKTSWVEKTRREHEVWSGHFLKLIGDKPIGAYVKSDARQFKKALRSLPANWNKQQSLKNLSFGKASEQSIALGLSPMSDANANKVLGFVGSLWTWAEREFDEVATNPFRGLKTKLRRDARSERDPFTSDELKKIFSAPIYTGCRSPRHWKQPGNVILRESGKYWVPLISLFSGARLGEILQLRTENVKQEGDITFFDLVDEYEDQRLKTAHSKRQIPVHPFLMSLGLAQLIETRRNEGTVRLFPELKMGRDGYYSTPYSKTFNSQFLPSVGAKRTKTTFHSFRHNFEDACRNSQVPKEVMDTLQGHGESGMAGRYGKGFVLSALNEWINKIEYENLDLSHLLVVEV